MILRFLTFSIIFTSLIDSQYSNWFNCPSRCQCYEDPEDRTHSIHLICKWEQLNTTNLQTLLHPEFVRTLTIRCPHNSRTKSRPPAGLFTGLRNLDRLEIDRCLIESLPGELFSGLHQLYSLIVKNARLSDIPNGLFTHLPNLMTLDLTGNLLKIEPYALRSLKNLIHLDLSNNSIAFLANTLISLDKLKVLTMDHNRLTNIDFRRLPEELTDLSLRHNIISTLHYIPPSARNIRRLDLAFNTMDFVSGSGSVNVLPSSLKTLDLSNNRIVFIQDGAMEKLDQLILLDLKNNSISELKESALAGPTARLRLFLSNNPFVCGCSMKWMVQGSNKLSPNILDINEVICNDLLRPELQMNITTAYRLNNLMCKYESMCSPECQCCRHSDCECRVNCPTGCQCYKSSRTEVEEEAQNIVICEGLRIDKLDDVPDSVTELRLAGDWREWSPDKLGKLKWLRTLNLTQTRLTHISAKNIAHFPRLSAIDLSANGFQKFPTDLPGINELYLSNNPLKEFTSKDLTHFDILKKVSFGGNHTSFRCDCETPSALQRWLRSRRNREKVADLDFVVCDLPLHGKVRIVDSLPGNDTLCNEETDLTSNWIAMVGNIETKYNFSTTTAQSTKKITVHPLVVYASATTIQKVLPTDGIYEKSLELESTKVQNRVLQTPQPHPRRRGRIEPESHRLLNVLIFILFVCVIILIVAIAFTLYFRFIRTDVVVGTQEKPHHERKPLNEA